MDVPPFSRSGSSENVYDSLHLLDLELVLGSLLRVEKRSQAQKLSEEAADSPHVDRGGIVLGTQEKLRRTIPERHHDPVRLQQVLQRFLENPRRAKVCDLRPALLGIQKNVRGLQIPVHDPVGVEVIRSPQDLPKQGLHRVRRDGPLLGKVVPNQLLQIAGTLLVREEDALLSPSHVDLFQPNDVLVAQLPQQANLPYSRSAHAVLALRLVRLDGVPSPLLVLGLHDVYDPL
mmetsp:Transcript_1274/g.3699  ORF Transcript_1274/g.3699 Transcript_1274/m.3699 type:complete len:232 (-) Transcript_1274:137-832(-)